MEKDSETEAKTAAGMGQEKRQDRPRVKESWGLEWWGHLRGNGEPLWVVEERRDGISFQFIAIIKEVYHGSSLSQSDGGGGFI